VAIVGIRSERALTNFQRHKIKIGERSLILPKADARTSTVFIDEFDPRGFKGSPDHIQSGSSWTACSTLQLMNGNGTNPSSLSEILLAPADESAGCSTLGGGDHPVHWQKHRISSTPYICY
jgi:hypothetical protein